MRLESGWAPGHAGCDAGRSALDVSALGSRMRSASSAFRFGQHPAPYSGVESTPEYEAVARLLTDHRGAGRVIGTMPRSSTASDVVLMTERMDAGPEGTAGRHTNPARPASTRTPALRISHFPDPHHRRYPRQQPRGRPRPPDRSNPPLDIRGVPMRRTLGSEARARASGCLGEAQRRWREALFCTQCPHGRTPVSHPQAGVLVHRRGCRRTWTGVASPVRVWAVEGTNGAGGQRTRNC